MLFTEKIYVKNKNEVRFNNLNSPESEMSDEAELCISSRKHLSVTLKERQVISQIAFKCQNCAHHVLYSHVWWQIKIDCGKI